MARQSHDIGRQKRQLAARLQAAIDRKRKSRKARRRAERRARVAAREASWIANYDRIERAAGLGGITAVPPKPAAAERQSRPRRRRRRRPLDASAQRGRPLAAARASHPS